MKLKLISILAGTLVLTLPLTSIVARAQTTTLPTQTLPGLSGVKLTQQQQKRLAQIRQTTQSELEGIITAEQQNLYKEALEGGKSQQEAIAAMNISADQQKKLGGVMRSFRRQIEATLTRQQLQQIQRNVRSRQEQRN